MTHQEIKEAKEWEIYPKNRICNECNHPETVENTTETKNESQQSILHQLNFTNGIAAFCVETMVNQEQLKKHKEEIRYKKMVGESTKKKFDEAKQLSDGIAFKAGELHLGKSILEFQKNSIAKKKKHEEQAQIKAYNKYASYKRQADEVIEKNGDKNKWTAA